MKIYQDVHKGLKKKNQPNISSHRMPSFLTKTILVSHTKHSSPTFDKLLEAAGTEGIYLNPNFGKTERT